jgi:hypothetical protein
VISFFFACFYLCVLFPKGQGFITEASFTSGKLQAYFQSFGTWKQLKDFFDEDGDDAIDPAE